MKNIVLFLVTLFLSCHMMAQHAILTGTVLDGPGGAPLIGANVVVKGTTVGTVTDADGNFRLDIPADKTILIFSSIGYKSQEITLKKGQKNVRVVLTEDTELLEEVVVVGYGTMRKSDLTGSVSNLSGDKMRQSVSANMDQMLQGRVAGVQVQSNSGAPGAATSIRIRGASSINNSNEPLYIIDGVPMSGSGTATAGFDWSGGSNGQNVVNPLAGISPSDIESTVVLKDASATAIYGAAGANGVVLITTKRGAKGEMKVNYDGYGALQQRTGKLDMMDLREFGIYQRQLFDEGILPDINEAYLDPSLLGKGTDWQDAVTSNAWMQSHNLSVTGGGEKTTYAFSMGYLNQDGLLLNSDFERFSGRMNIDTQVFKYLKTGASLSYARTTESIINNDGINGVVMQAALMSPSVPVYDFDGNYAGPETVNGSSLYNPVALTKDMKNKFYRSRVMGNIYAQIDFFSWLNFRTEFGFDASNNTNKGFKPSYEYGQLKNTDIQIMQRDDNSIYWIWKNYATYIQSFGKHSVNFMAGTETAASDWEGTQLVKNGLSSNIIQVIGPDGKYTSNNGWKDRYTKVSGFGRLNYNYADRYMLTATMRADASSKFGSNNRWGYFPSFAAAWRISSEKFMESSQQWLSDLKLRLGYGHVGNDNINTYLYGSTMNPFSSYWGTAYRMANNANPDLKWETSIQYNLGFDLGLFNNWVTLTAEAYYKTTKDLLLQPSVSPVLGGSSNIDIQTPFMNIGEVENKGIDISFDSRNIETRNFSWTSNLIVSINRNKVKKLDDLGTTFYSGLDWYAGFQSVSMVKVGQPIGVFYGYKTDGLYRDAEDLYNSARPKNIQIHRNQGSWVGDVKFQDISGPNGTPDGVIDEYDQTVIGDPNPDFTFGFTNTFRYRNWDLGIGLTGAVGGDVLNYVRAKTEGLNSAWDNQSRAVNNRAILGYSDGNKNNVTDPTNCYITNANASLPRWTTSDLNGNGRMSDRWIEDGSYLRIQNLSLGYNFPQEWIKKIAMQNCRLYFNVQNVYTFSNYSGLDPEIGSYNQNARLSGVDMGRYPAPRVYTLGVNITF